VDGRRKDVELERKLEKSDVEGEGGWRKRGCRVVMEGKLR
jgi:hypothetical protein